jgi:hypothetical protein
MVSRAISLGDGRYEADLDGGLVRFRWTSSGRQLAAFRLQDVMAVEPGSALSLNFGLGEALKPVDVEVLQAWLSEAGE